MPTVSAKGAKIGIDSTAKPEDDGTTKPSRKNTTISIMINSGPDMPETKFDDQNSKVSEIIP